jgi:hypothetical protein
MAPLPVGASSLIGGDAGLGNREVLIVAKNTG